MSPFNARQTHPMREQRQCSFCPFKKRDNLCVTGVAGNSVQAQTLSYSPSVEPLK